MCNLQSILMKGPDSGVDWTLVVGVGSLAVAVAALLFTLSSFWWLYARRGSLMVGRPGTYAYVARTLRLRLPLAFYNSGAQALIVSDLRATVVNGPPRPPLRWIANVSQLQPTGRNERDFSTPFAVTGRNTREFVAEFGGTWCPLLGTTHRLRLQAKIHPKDEWQDLMEFDWWAPQQGSSMTQYLTYRNAAREELPLDEVPQE